MAKEKIRIQLNPSKGKVSFDTTFPLQQGTFTITYRSNLFFPIVKESDDEPTYSTHAGSEISEGLLKMRGVYEVRTEPYHSEVSVSTAIDQRGELVPALASLARDALKLDENDLEVEIVQPQVEHLTHGDIIKIVEAVLRKHRLI